MLRTFSQNVGQPSQRGVTRSPANIVGNPLWQRGVGQLTVYDGANVTAATYFLLGDSLTVPYSGSGEPRTFRVMHVNGARLQLAYAAGLRTRKTALGRLIGNMRRAEPVTVMCITRAQTPAAQSCLGAPRGGDAKLAS